MKCNDYSEKKYIVGEIPTLEVLNSCLQDEEIVYSLINILKKRVQKGCGIDVSNLATKDEIESVEYKLKQEGGL